jgi:8-oxo-dGTP pyrophosphatase MutT (NUDIX family)
LDNSLHALLLKRNSKHNDNTWGIPGGNADAGEIMLDTASREAVEEMGGCPGMTILDYVLTRCVLDLFQRSPLIIHFLPYSVVSRIIDCLGLKVLG